MPAGQILLASSLKERGFAPTPLPLAISGKNGLSEALSADMAGITLFEDLLPLLGPILADFRLSYKGIMAAGGPFPTLAPMAAIFHLPEINLMARGEAELALPDILKALNEGDAEGFFAHAGVYWQHDGVIAMAGWDKAERPENLQGIPIDLDFMKPGDLVNGLEMNFSRGCRRGCVFCCRAQGSRLRKLPLEKAEELLKAYKSKVESSIDALKSPRPLAGPPPLVRGGDLTKSATSVHPSCPPLSKGGKGGDLDAPPYLAVNINDDDILQDPEYAREIFSLVKGQGFRIFGVQTSTASLVNNAGEPCCEALDLAADPGLYVGARALLWLGTDTFLQERAMRLGKKLPPPDQFRGLMVEMERRKIRHYHYWISSDGDSTWTEFIEELALIFGFFRDFPGFGLLAHAPFVVPYPSSALFSRLPAGDPRLKVRLSLDAPDPRFRYKVVARLETSWPQLNALLRNEKAGGEKGFLDFLKERDLVAAAQLGYHFLKKEIYQAQAQENPQLVIARDNLERVIGGLI